MLGTASFAVILCKFSDIAIPDLPISFFGAVLTILSSGTRPVIHSGWDIHGWPARRRYTAA
jgi:hypothetical protein